MSFHGHWDCLHFAHEQLMHWCFCKCGVMRNARNSSSANPKKIMVSGSADVCVHLSSCAQCYYAIGPLPMKCKRTGCVAMQLQFEESPLVMTAMQGTPDLNLLSYEQCFALTCICCADNARRWDEEPSTIWCELLCQNGVRKWCVYGVSGCAKMVSQGCQNGVKRVRIWCELLCRNGVRKGCF